MHEHGLHSSIRFSISQMIHNNLEYFTLLVLVKLWFAIYYTFFPKCRCIIRITELRIYAQKRWHVIKMLCLSSNRIAKFITSLRILMFRTTNQLNPLKSVLLEGIKSTGKSTRGFYKNILFLYQIIIDPFAMHFPTTLKTKLWFHQGHVAVAHSHTMNAKGLYWA